MDVKKLLAKGAELQKISNAMPSKADMIAAFGPECVEEIKDEDGNVIDTRYYYIRPWMSDEQKVKNWHLFNEMVAKARGLEIERSERITAEREGPTIIHPGGDVLTVSPGVEKIASRKPGFRPKIEWGGNRRRYAWRNGVMVPIQ